MPIPCWFVRESSAKTDQNNYLFYKSRISKDGAREGPLLTFKQKEHYEIY